MCQQSVHTYIYYNTISIKMHREKEKLGPHFKMFYCTVKVLVDYWIFTFNYIAFSFQFAPLLLFGCKI